MLMLTMLASASDSSFLENLKKFFCMNERKTGVSVYWKLASC